MKPCRFPALSDHIRRCELFGIPEDAARLRFRDFMTTRAAPAAVAFPGKVVAVSNIAIWVPTHFLSGIGRPGISRSPGVFVSGRQVLAPRFEFKD